ncbi:type 1 fimbrial protein, partial [Delftia tsuruhatensis]
TPNTSNHVIPLTARYVQTQPSVTTGLANGRATFTLNYQ